jgi:cullin 3
MSQYEVDQVLREAFQLFRYLDAKDIFERYYRQHLARRLLLNKSLGDNIEYTIIYKLKVSSFSIIKYKEIEFLFQCYLL